VPTQLVPIEEMTADQKREHVASVQRSLDALNPTLFGEGSRLGMAYVRYIEVREQDINANVMPVGMFNALVSNVQKNSALESLPLCATRASTPDVIEVVSGHHRVRAANAAGIEFGVVLLYRGLTDSEIKAKQLAHNAIQGSSDPDIVREIFTRIVDLDARVESYIDPNTIQPPPEPVRFEQIDVDPLADAKQVSLIFLPTQARDFSRAMEQLKTEPDVIYLASREAFDGFRDAVNRVRADLEILAYPTALTEMARLALKGLDVERAEREAAARTHEPVVESGAGLEELRTSAAAEL
jgi:hypothetical protein